MLSPHKEGPENNVSKLIHLQFVVARGRNATLPEAN